MPSYILSIDQGTTSTRAQVYDERGRCVSNAARELTQHYPGPGWVEHDAEEIWASVREVVPRAVADAGIDAGQVVAVGVTNQRETSLLWERATGDVLGRAIVWQDRRTADFCNEKKNEEPWIRERTGLVLDPYFSATKFRWMLAQDPAWRKRAEAGTLAGGTIDSFLIHRLTGKKVLATDATNASRTLLMDLATGRWDEDLCRFFEVPAAILPEIRPSAADFGTTAGLDFLPDGLPILGVAGDQQAALFGHAAFQPGEAKSTYGTGAFFLQHLGANRTISNHRLLTSLAAGKGRLEYVLEGSVFIAGAAVQWLRDGLKLLNSAGAIEQLAQQSDPDQPILFVPGFVGLGAPHWVPEARGVLFGLTRNTSIADVGRATLEGVAYQVADLVDAAGKDAHKPLESLSVDGGMARNAWFLQCQADILNIPVIQSKHTEVTARGAAFLAGWQAGVWPELSDLRALPLEMNRFEPRLPEADRQRRLTRWRRAVKAVIAYYLGND
jgi:glycerol kinase